MEVRVISRGNIKPSSPTPHHLRIHKLSLLDQLIPAPYAPLVYFFANEDGAAHLQVQERLGILKKSLSETLSRFYPLAGKLENDLTIACNDEGAFYVEAEVNCHLGQFLNRPDLQLIHKFLPSQAGFTGSVAGTPVTNIQVNLFQCGGIAIGLCISHRIADGSSLNSFMKSWAETSSGSIATVYPNFLAYSLFPTDNLWLRDSSIATWGPFFKMGKSSARRFVFDASAIATLKAKSASSRVQNPTRVETVSAFIWERAKAASEKISGSCKSSMLTHIVNLRRRMVPPVSDHSIGNLIWVAATQCPASPLGLPDLVCQVREGISKINSDYVKKLRSNERCSIISKSFKRTERMGTNERADYYGFTSWCNLGFYETDFGWGRPVWISGIGSGGPVFLNLAVLMETRNCDGIEAWVTLDEKQMSILEHDPELLKLASVDPSPLIFC
ncbi:Alcohol O-acetyltransferase [Bertholletia excelsa]